MKENFERCWLFVQKWEGGAKVTKDPDDLGGTTKWGISQRAYPHLDIENLTEEQAKEIAIKEYWEPMGCNDSTLAWPYDLILFDSAFNCGIRTADGFDTNNNEGWTGILLNRIFYYLRLVRKNPVLRKYLEGWLNRCYDLYKESTNGTQGF